MRRRASALPHHSRLLFIDTPDGALLGVRVTPRAGRSALAGVRDGVLLVRLAAAPVEGAANAALVELLSTLLDVPRRDIRNVSGERGRSKRLLFSGHPAADLEARLAPLVPRR